APSRPPARPRPRPARSRAATSDAAAARRAPASRSALAPSASGALRGGLALGLGVSGGVLPDLGAVLDVGARVELLPWALELSLRHWPDRSHRRDGRALEVSASGARR